MTWLGALEAVGFGAIALACAGFGYAALGALGGVCSGLLVGGVELVWYANIAEGDDADDS